MIKVDESVTRSAGLPFTEKVVPHRERRSLVRSRLTTQLVVFAIQDDTFVVPRGRRDGTVWGSRIVGEREKIRALYFCKNLER